MSSVHIPYFILCAYSLANVILGRNCKWALDSTRCTFLNEFSQIWSRNDLFLGAGLQLGYVSRSDWYLGPGQFILQVHFRERCTFWKQVWIILRKLSSISVCQHPTNFSLWSFLVTHNFCRTPFWGRLVILFTFVPPTVCVWSLQGESVLCWSKSATGNKFPNKGQTRLQQTDLFLFRVKFHHSGLSGAVAEGLTLIWERKLFRKVE